MPFQDVIQNHIAPADIAQTSTLIGQLETLLQPKLRNLNEEENNTYGSINEQNKLFVNKVFDYRNSQPALSSPDVDWVEFSDDYDDRGFLEQTANRLMASAKTMIETKPLHEYDNYQNALIDYDYSQYKDRTQPGLGYDSKVAELKQFFPNTGGSGNP